MKRWPFRKRNSLGRLIDRTKQVLDDGTGQDNMQKLAALQVLEKQRQIMRVGFLSVACHLLCCDIVTCHSDQHSDLLSRHEFVCGGAVSCGIYFIGLGLQ